MNRTVTALIATPLVAMLYGVLIYGFVVYVWPRLPAWMIPVAFVILAIFLVGSPIMALARLARRQTPPH